MENKEINLENMIDVVRGPMDGAITGYEINSVFRNMAPRRVVVYMEPRKGSLFYDSTIYIDKESFKTFSKNHPYIPGLEPTDTTHPNLPGLEDIK